MAKNEKIDQNQREGLSNPKHGSVRKSMDTSPNFLVRSASRISSMLNRQTKQTGSAKKLENSKTKFRHRLKQEFSLYGNNEAKNESNLE